MEAGVMTWNHTTTARTHGCLPVRFCPVMGYYPGHHGWWLGVFES